MLRRQEPDEDRGGGPAVDARELEDRLAIRTLVDAYARCADRRDAEGQKALFTDDTRFVVYMDGEGSEPSRELNGREALTPVFGAWLFAERRLYVDWIETRRGELR